MSEKAIDQLRAQINELLDAARSGQIIPIRLPGQVEALLATVDQVEKEHQEEIASRPSTLPPDLDAYMTEEAYFVGHAVHELRTPMTSIRGYTDMLGQMGELNDMQKQFLTVIKTNARRMESLLADVSYANKIRKGTLKVAKKMDMFKNIAMRVEKDMTPLAEELGRKLEFDIPQGLPFLETDGDLLTVAINKLVENALRYSEADSVVRVSASASAEDSILVIEVADEGIGMTPEETAQLGTIYFRSENDAVRAHKGSGLGIPIAYGLIDKLGGSIGVTSEAGVGTHFTIRLTGMS